jgi:hypothetical protein
LIRDKTIKETTMKRLSRVLLALLILFSAGCAVPKSQNIVPTPVIVPTIVPTAVPTVLPTVTVTEQQNFNQRVNRLNPSLRRYVKRLYRDYRENGWKYKRWSPLHQFILDTQRKAAKQFKYDGVINKEGVYQTVYGLKVYSLHWKSNQDWNTSYFKHESGFLDIAGDKYSKRTHKLNTPDHWSIGKGQVQLDSAYGNLKARGINPAGLTPDDLLYFRLMNMDISICIMAAKVKHFGYKNGTKAYNAGDGSWYDGRSDQYYRDVLSIYGQRSKWSPIPTATPTVVIVPTPVPTVMK